MFPTGESFYPMKYMPSFQNMDCLRVLLLDLNVIIKPHGHNTTWETFGYNKNIQKMLIIKVLQK